MIRLERRILRDPIEIDGPARVQDCVVDDTRRLLIQWTEAGTWYPAGEQGFHYVSPAIGFDFLANIGGDSADEGRSADGRIFVLLNGLDDAATSCTLAVFSRVAADIEAAMLLWPDLVPSGATRRVWFWFPDQHPAQDRPPAALRRMIGIDPTVSPAHDDADLDWFRSRIWKGAIA